MSVYPFVHIFYTGNHKVCSSCPRLLSTDLFSSEYKPYTVLLVAGDDIIATPPAGPRLPTGDVPGAPGVLAARALQQTDGSQLEGGHRGAHRAGPRWTLQADLLLPTPGHAGPPAVSQGGGILRVAGQRQLQDGCGFGRRHGCYEQ